MKLKELEINDAVKRIVNELEKKVNDFLQARKNRGEKSKKEDFFIEAKKNKVIFPVTKDTYYDFTKSINKTSKYMLKRLDVRDLYKICQYTDISADYYLGFIDTKRKEPSAPAVRECFGLSDKSMHNLKEFKETKGEEKGGLSADLVNYVLEDSDFWKELGDKLPAYIAALIYNLDDINTDATRYGTMKVFERLLDNLSKKCIDSDLPVAEIDQVAPFQF